MKTIIQKTIARAASLLLGVMATASVSAETATYIDADGIEQTADNAVVVTSSTTTFTDGGWYVVNGAVTTGMITVNGTANLILADGATLKSTGTAKYDPGIKVTSGNTLVIYGQSAGTGALVASGNESKCAGIGGGSVNNAGQACGTVKIYGGNIEATGVKGAAGIGGGAGGSSSGSGGAGGTVEIYGGTVTATAGAVNGSSYGAGIGGGVANNTRASNGTLTVAKGMTVVAGTDAGSATARTPDAQTGAVTISTSGTADRYFKITAPTALTQTVSDLGEIEQGAEQSWNLAGMLEGNVTPYVFSGEVPSGFSFTEAGVLTLGDAKGGVYTNRLTVAGSAAPRLSKPVEFTWTVTVLSAPKTITYYDGENVLDLAPASYRPGIGATLPTLTNEGYDFLGWCTDSSLEGDAVTAVGTDATEDLIFYAKWAVHDYAITYMDGASELKELVPTSYTIEAAAALPATATKEGKDFIGWYDNADFTGDAVTEIALGSTGDKTFYAKFVPSRAPATYIDADGDEQTAPLCITIDDADPETYAFEDGGWYVVKSNVAFTNVALTVSGNVNLIIADGATMSVTNTNTTSTYGAGISVTDGNSLTIYGQSEGSGELVVSSGYRSAGIGTIGVSSGSAAKSGDVTIYGGHITVTGGQYAAGIGGGGAGSTRTGGAGGDVTVYGGFVKATGGSNGVGIGGGRGSSASDQGSLTVAAGLSCVTNGTTVTISEPGPLAQSVSTLENGVETKGTTWNLAEMVTGGVAPYAFSNLDTEGFSVTEEGVLTLGDAKGGSYDITLTVTDSGSKRFVQSKEFTWTVTILNAPKTITYMDGETTLTGLEPTQYNPGVEESITTAVPTKTGYTFAGWYANAELTGDAVTAVPASATGTQTFYAAWTAKTYTITYMDGNTAIEGLVPTNYTVEAAATLPETAEKSGYGFYGWFDNAATTGDEVTEIAKGTTGDKVFYAKWGDPWVDATYMGADGQEATARSVVVTSSTTTFEDGGWYVVNSDITVSSITNSGTANLILADGATLTAAGAYHSAGIAIPASGTLSIYGQSAGTGALVATGGSKGAGIGGGSSGDDGVACGTVKIYGGNITATGGKGAGAIGGGAGSSSKGSGGAGGTVEIHGGTVTAIASSETNGTNTYGPAIGGGTANRTMADGGIFANYGGTVVARGVSNANAVDIGATFTIVGGSTYLANGAKTGDATDGNDNAVYCVTVPDLEASTKYVFKNLGDYGQANLVSDEGGKVYLWLADGSHSVTALGYEWTATVDGANTTATRDVATVEVEKVVETALVSVPEVCTVATLVDTEDEKRDVGDKIVAFNTETRKYDTWQLALVGETLVWEPVARMSTGSDKVEYPAAASEYNLNGGQAVWVQRVNENKPIVLKGKYTETREQTVEVTAGWTLLAPLPKAGEAAYDLNGITVEGGTFSGSDKIVISGNEAPVNCFRKDDKWQVYTGTVEADDDWGAIFTDGEWVPAPKIAEGEGFFFVTEGSKTLRF